MATNDAAISSTPPGSAYAPAAAAGTASAASQAMSAAEAQPASESTSLPPFNRSMAAMQNSDAERASPPPRESSLPTINSVPTVDPNQPPEDPQVASLRAMFPDFDAAVLQSVLESVRGNQDRAIDMLLGMSDPDYIPQQPPEPVQSQTDLDEEFARQLMLEEQQQQQQNWHPDGQQHFGGSSPYGPQARGNQWQPQQAPPGGQRDTMAEFQGQVARIADTGKKTFNSLFSKAKAKLQEFDQQRTGQSSSQTNTQPSWGAADQQQHQYYEPPANAQIHPSYYDPNPQSQRQDSFESSRGYDATPPQSSQSSPPAPARSQAPSFPTALSTDTPQPPPTSSGAPHIDLSKLGMLPKRPVSLLRDPSQPVHHSDDDDDDELEYAENPFEDHAHK